MKTTELKIGNYVLRKNIPNEYLKILSIDSIKNTTYLELGGLGIMEKNSKLEPIELTEELLVKIGFKKEKRLKSILFHLDCEIDVDNIISVNYSIYPNDIPLLQIRTFQTEDEKYEWVEFVKRGVKHLHELQNGFYCLTNQEMEIKL